MDWKQILSHSSEQLQNDDKKDEIYEELIYLENFQNIDNKGYKKLFKLAQFILIFKGEQVTSLLSELDTLATKQGEQIAFGNLDDKAVNEEMIKIKKQVEKLETDKLQSKIKIKELSEEIYYLQKKHQEVQYDSDKDDSPDQLSDIDRQQELLNNISMKNKHIKRLLRDIESLEKQNTEQIDTINELRKNLTDTTMNMAGLTYQFTESQDTIKDQKLIIESLHINVKDLGYDIANLQNLSKKREEEIDIFARQLEERAYIWKNVLDEKQHQLDALQIKYDEILYRNSEYDISLERQELRKLSEDLKERDQIIKDLESKLYEMSCEMINSTNAMNKLTSIKENARKNIKPSGDNCCDNLKILLEKSNERCKEYQDMLTNIEEDNLLKSKQAVEAIKTLHLYQSGENGLPEALKTITELEQKVTSRDKQIRTLIMELNTANEYGNENCILRKRLGVPDDENISSKSLFAKQRKLQKLNERLTLKLRASEEMRLQLKLEKTELKRQILSLNTQKLKIEDKDEIDLSQGQDGSQELPSVLETKFCENCFGQYKQFEQQKYCDSCVAKQNCNLCENCKTKLKIDFKHDSDKHKQNIKELEKNYAYVVEENENLRIGMHEILYKLREYDAMSSHITIDTTTLEKLLHALDARSVSGWYHPAMRIQNELIVSKEREIALRERVRISEGLTLRQNINSDISKDNQKEGNFTIELNLDDYLNNTAAVFDKSEIVENQRKFSQDTIKIENLTLNLRELNTQIENQLIEINELKILKNQYNKLIESLEISDNGNEKYLAEITTEITKTKLELNIEKKKCEFLITEQENMNKLLKKLKCENINLVAEYKKEITENNKIIQKIQIENKFLQNSNDFIEQKEFQNIQNELILLKIEMGNLCSSFFKNIKIFDNENLGNLDVDKIMKIGIIDENLIVNFIAITEYDEIRKSIQMLKDDFNKVSIKCQHLEQVLKISEEQIISQQQILSKFSDEEISLRHIIVDLQSQSNEKYIIAKSYRELENYKENEEKCKIEMEKLSKEIIELKNKIDELKIMNEKKTNEIEMTNKNNSLKIRYLSKALMELNQRYCKFTPLYPMFDFIKNYSIILELRDRHKKSSNEILKECDEKVKQMLEKFKEENHERGNQNGIQNKIEMVKYKTQNEYLENTLHVADNKVKELQKEIDDLKMKEISLTQHWRAIEMLFSNENEERVTFVDKGTQIMIEKTDKSTLTDVIDDLISTTTTTTTTSVNPTETEQMIANNNIKLNASNEISQTNKCLESQLKQAMILASTRSTLLLETENRLTETQGRIKAIERVLDEKEKLLKQEREKNSNSEMSGHKGDNVLVVTISSLQKLLLEKDTTLSKYQELLKTERQENIKTFEENQKEMKNLKEFINEIENKLMEKEKELGILENEKSMEILLGNNQPENKEIEVEKKDENNLIKSDQILIEISDNYIENMFLEEKQELELEERNIEYHEMSIKIVNCEQEIQRLQYQLRDVNNREKIWEKNLSEKNKEIELLHEKINKNQMDRRDISENITNRRDIEQLRDMLEEKDRHIHDLTDTLTHFHDDQQRFINDTSLHSAEQVAQLSSDINIRDATNRVLNTQIDALKRQITNLSQREKQARELVKTLKNQLIRRPVISVKPERTTTTREDHLQRKVHQLESEIIEIKEELRKQTNLAETRKSKNAADLDLWNKQKHWQQSSEKLKIKLKEKENEVEKVKANFQIAKSTILRLEREKHILEGRNRSAHYCTTSSCPNIHPNKYTPAESPESYITNSDYGPPTVTSQNKRDFLENHPEMMEALKSKVESQQRRIIAMELEGKGSHSLSTEYERLQERLASLEASNLKLEAKNLQLQLDYDMVKQGDDSERVKRQIKHLEDYIVVLKDELSQALSVNIMTGGKNSVCKVCLSHNEKFETGSDSQMEQTILALRRVVERLKVDNKNLREGKNFVGKSTVAKEIYDKLKKDFDKIQQTYSEALDKISSLQIEIDTQTVTCSNCKQKMDSGSLLSGNSDELRLIKEKLNQKTQLLEKAKVLLTRAAAKEKNLREQIDFWKRRCSELQNVPVIDETSEGDNSESR